MARSQDGRVSATPVHGEVVIGLAGSILCYVMCSVACGVGMVQ